MYSFCASALDIFPSLFQASLCKNQDQRSENKSVMTPRKCHRIFNAPFHALDDLQAAGSRFIARSSGGLLKETIKAELKLIGDVLDGGAWSEVENGARLGFKMVRTMKRGIETVANIPSCTYLTAASNSSLDMMRERTLKGLVSAIPPVSSLCVFLSSAISQFVALNMVVEDEKPHRYNYIT